MMTFCFPLTPHMSLLEHSCFPCIPISCPAFTGPSISITPAFQILYSSLYQIKPPVLPRWLRRVGWDQHFGRTVKSFVSSSLQTKEQKTGPAFSKNYVWNLWRNMGKDNFQGVGRISWLGCVGLYGLSVWAGNSFFPGFRPSIKGDATVKQDTDHRTRGGCNSEHCWLLFESFLNSRSVTQK